MAGVAHLVRALDCGSGGSGFETHRSPQRYIGLNIDAKQTKET
jgi:hypothetical protein